MKKFTLVIAAIIAICFIPLAWGYARTLINRAKTPAASAKAITQGNPVKHGVFVADDMPVTITGFTVSQNQAANQTTGAAADQTEGLPQVEFNVASKGGHKIKSLTFTLYDFDEKGLLRRVESRGQSIDVNDERGPTKITLQLERKLNPLHRQVLALEHVRGEGSTWRADGPGLGRAANRISNGLPSSATVNRVEKVLPDETGSVLCSNGFRRAMQLAQLGNGQSVTSFTCDQNSRSFSFTFNGKDLGQ